MAKVKTENAQSKTAAVEGSQVENQNENNEKNAKEQTSKAKVTTTEGNTIDRIRIFQKDDATMVQADYGKLNPEGKTSEEKRAGI